MRRGSVVVTLWVGLLASAAMAQVSVAMTEPALYGNATPRPLLTLVAIQSPLQALVSLPSATPWAGGFAGRQISNGQLIDQVVPMYTTHFQFDTPLNRFGGEWDLSLSPDGGTTTLQGEAVAIRFITADGGTAGEQCVHGSAVNAIYNSCVQLSARELGYVGFATAEPFVVVEFSYLGVDVSETFLISALTAGLVVPDAGPVRPPSRDAGAETDAGLVGDAGLMADAGLVADAGLTADAGELADGGVTAEPAPGEEGPYFFRSEGCTSTNAGPLLVLMGASLAALRRRT
jgi:uncharacterized protein (TIGR03382 family)